MNATRFWELVEKTDSCWLWQGTKTKGGYGRVCIWINGDRVRLAHRASYLLAYGEIPGERTDRTQGGKMVRCIDHLCSTPACVRPDHLDPCGKSENSRRQKWQLSHTEDGITFCKRGHPLTAENVRRHGKAQKRHCVPCSQLMLRARRARLRNR